MDVAATRFTPDLLPYLEIGVDQPVVRMVSITGGIGYSVRTPYYYSGYAEDHWYWDTYDLLATWNARVGVRFTPSETVVPFAEIGVLASKKDHYDDTQFLYSDSLRARIATIVDPYWMIGLAVPVSGVTFLFHFGATISASPWTKQYAEEMFIFGCRILVAIP